MFRKTIFWLHLACGVSAGVVVLMMSVTGVVLTYERQAQVWEDRSYYAEPETGQLMLIAVQLGLSAMMLASIRAREHEIHLLRVIGAPPWFLLVKWERDWEQVLYCSERCRRNKGACLALIP